MLDVEATTKSDIETAYHPNDGSVWMLELLGEGTIREMLFVWN